MTSFAEVKEYYKRPISAIFRNPFAATSGQRKRRAETRLLCLSFDYRMKSRGAVSSSRDEKIVPFALTVTTIG